MNDSERLRWNENVLDYLLNSPDGPIGRDMERRAIIVENTQKRLLSQHGTGRIYYRHRVAHQASAPGEPPAVDTGRLRASIGHRVWRTPTGLVADIGSGANPALPGVVYAVYLERGTHNDDLSVRMEPRPFLRPSMKDAEL